VLPPEVYERWRVLKAEYAPRDDDLERFRPSFAMEKLEEEIAEKLGRPSISAQPQPQPPPQPRGPALRPLVDKAAKRHKVKVRTMPKVELKLKINNTREMLRFVREFDLVEAKCVALKLEYLERRIEYVKRLAAGPQPEQAPDRVQDCNEADLMMKKLQSGEIPDTAGILKLIDTARKQMKLSNEQLDAEWIAAAEAALAANTSTFAVLSMGWNGDVSHINSQIAKLRELGYEVEEPEGN
jgi:hypothetical protein